MNLARIAGALAPALAALVAVLAVAPRDAHAVAACYSNQGFAPGAGVKLPRHPRIAWYVDRPPPGRTPQLTATIDGAAVPVKLSTVRSPPYTIRILEIDSDRTGHLELRGDATASYQIVADAAMPKDVPVVVGRTQVELRHTTVREKFDALALRLPLAAPAIVAHVKVRRDAQARWSELDVPVVATDLGDPRPAIRLGELGCTRNYSVDLLAAGVDLEVTITLADGTTRPAAELPAHVALP